ncbi:hypothetical protein JAAARDRAFT_58476 [Jaapia argillacea MUCL 33604]|uniref:BTB domain-containing protein n=1 Tax=Jaapia argillacea MUCL 33604 TaxID=933084 RepID=A0A067PQG5_9AGAM|nr:hypothetical protein JAAARDRAFT_58476 [Jaapia argillacea MUCL 33604]
MDMLAKADCRSSLINSTHIYQSKASPHPDFEAYQSCVYTQVPTPPASEYEDSLQLNGLGESTVTVSTAFYPGSEVDPHPTDLILGSLDGVFFYVHHHRLLRASANQFNSLLSLSYSSRSGEDCPVVALPDHSSVLNIVLHAIYEMSVSQFSPSTADLSSGIAALRIYGLPIDKCLVIFASLSSSHARCTSGTDQNIRIGSFIRFA